MAKQKKSMIGLDPLAWLKDEAEDAEVIEESKAEVKDEKKKEVSKKKVTSKKKSTTKSTAKKPAKKDAVADVIFKIKEIQDISTVADVHTELKELFSHDKVILDGSEVERIDAASLQLIYSFIEEAREKNIQVAWLSPSNVLLDNAKLLGMEDVLLLNNVA